MRKLILTIGCLLLAFSYSAEAQQKEFEWRLGVSGGYSKYYGDLTPYRIRGLSNWEAIHHLFYFNENYFERPSFKISLERQLNATIGLMLSYGQYHFAMSDRYIRKDGTLYLDNPNFERGLNFSNRTRDLGLSFVFKTDNDRLLSAKSWIAPYVTLGFGLVNFEVHGDLLDNAGLRYDYGSPNIIHDGKYETDLHSLRTELSNGYELGAFYTNLGLGFRIRLGKRFEIFAQSDFLYTFTDYLDDVSGRYRTFYDNDFQSYAARPGTNMVDSQHPYRGNPDGANDWIIYHGIGIKYNFGASKKTFSAPRLTTYYPEYGKTRIAEPLKIPASAPDSIPLTEKGNTYNYTYNIQLAETEKLDSLQYLSQILAWEQEILKRENRIVGGQARQKSLLELKRQFDLRYDSLKTERNLDPEEKEEFLLSAEKSNFDLRYSIDSIGRRERELKMEIDSIARLKRDYRMEQRVLVIPRLDSVPSGKEAVLLDPTKKEETTTAKSFQEESTRKEDLVTSGKETEIVEEMEDAPMKSEPTQAQELQPTSQTSPESANQDPERVRRLEEENQYLRHERDRLLTSASGQQRSQNTRPQRTTVNNRQTTTVQQERPRDESGRRRRWWWPFAAAGGVAATAAILADDDQEEEDSIVAQDSIAAIEPEIVALDQSDLENIALAVTSAHIGTSITGELMGQKEAGTTEILAPLPITSDSISGPEIIRDSIYVDNGPVVRILKSKEAVYFKVNQRVPDEEEITKLEDLAGFVNENEEYVLVLTGYADNTGNVTFNLKLADDRMNAVGEILKERFGLNDHQLRYESGGQVVRGTQKEANDLDRKVEVRAERSQ